MPEELQHLTPMVPLSFTYNYRVGEYMEKYLQGLAEKKILGVRCPGCKRVLLPPRSACGACNATPDEWIEIDPVGTLEARHGDEAPTRHLVRDVAGASHEGDLVGLLVGEGR